MIRYAPGFGGAAGLVGQARHRRDERLHAAAGGAAGRILKTAHIRDQRGACSGREAGRGFHQLPFKVLASPLPNDVGRRVVFVSPLEGDRNTAC
jgi:hypothetical protein